jgi:hypothetical protein
VLIASTEERSQRELALTIAVFDDLNVAAMALLTGIGRAHSEEIQR